jgi:hypothetical protein
MEVINMQTVADAMAVNITIAPMTYNTIAKCILQLPDYDRNLLELELQYVRVENHLDCGNNLYLVSIVAEKGEMNSHNLFTITVRSNWLSGSTRFEVTGVCEYRLFHVTTPLLQQELCVKDMNKYVKLRSTQITVKNYSGEYTPAEDEKSFIRNVVELAACDPQYTKNSSAITQLPRYVSDHIISKLGLKVTPLPQPKRTWG